MNSNKMLEGCSEASAYAEFTIATYSGIQSLVRRDLNNNFFQILNDRICCVMWNEGGTPFFQQSSYQPLTLNTWYKVHMTWGASTNSGLAKYYINGVFFENASDGLTSAMRSTVQNSFRIGNNESSTETWSGKLRCVKLWNRMLTESEISRDAADPYFS